MTSVFAWFTAVSAPIHFAGAPFILSAVLTLVSTILAIKSLRNEVDSN